MNSQVLVAFQPRVPPAEVERVLEQPLVVRADIERHREAARRVQAAGGDIERHLADRDAHAVRPEIAEAENALTVGHDYQVHARQRHALEDLVDVRDVVRAEVDAAVPPGDVTELQAGLAHRGRVDNGDHLVEVLDQQPVEQHLVAVQEALQEDELLHVVGLAPEVLERSLHLVLERRHARAQQSREFQRQALLLGERRRLVEHRVAQQLLATEVDLPGTPRSSVDRP